MATDLTTIEERIDDLYTEVGNDVQLLEAHKEAAAVDVDFINQQLAILDKQTMSIHDELHETAIDVDDNTSAINNIINQNYQSQLDDLELAYLGLDTTLAHIEGQFNRDMNRLENRINTQAQEVNVIMNEIGGEKEHVILSMTEFQQITPDENKIYLVYL